MEQMPLDLEPTLSHEVAVSTPSDIDPPVEQPEKIETARKQEVNNMGDENGEEDSGHVQHTMLQVIMLNAGLCVGIFIICLDTTILG